MPTIVNWGLFLFAVVGCLGLAAFADKLLTNPESQAARTTASALTASYGTEARLAIQAFIERNWSLAAFQDPHLLSEVATGQTLRDLQAIRRGWTSATIDVISSISIDKVQVIEYSPTQFKAFSCEVLSLDKVTIDGAYVNSLEPFAAFRMYVFNRDAGAWKVAAWADFTDVDHLHRDWAYVPQWTKDLIGDLPDLIDKYDTCFDLALPS